MSTQTQPAPVLAWHREAAKTLFPYGRHTYLGADADAFNQARVRDWESVASLIGKHDPHAETVRLLEEVLKLTREIGNDFNRHGESAANYSDGEYTQDYTTRSQRLAKVDCEIRAHLAALQQEGAAK